MLSTAAFRALLDDFAPGLVNAMDWAVYCPERNSALSGSNPKVLPPPLNLTGGIDAVLFGDSAAALYKLAKAKAGMAVPAVRRKPND